MITLRIMSYWSQDVEGVWRPRAAIDHNIEGGWQDITGGNAGMVPPDPNGAVYDMVVSEAEAALIETDVDLYVFNYSDDMPSESEYAQWRTYITSMRDDDNKVLWNTGQFNQAVGPVPDGRTWAEIMPDLLGYCRGIVR